MRSTPAATAPLPATAAITLAAHAHALLQIGEPREAARGAEQATRLDAGLAAAWFVLGAARRAAGEPEAAIAALQQATALAPRHAPAWLALGNAMADRGQTGESAALVRRAISLDPNLAEAHASLGAVLTASGDLAAATAACDTAIALAPDFAPAYWNRAFARLLAGDFPGGWADAEWRKLHPAFAADFAALHAPEWKGGDIAGRTLLVHAGQGMGDTIQFARYLPLLAAAGAELVLACAAALVPLLSQLPGIAVVPRAAGLPAHDTWVDQMSLPLLFATREETIPARHFYLRAAPHRTAAWCERLGQGLRIGLAWAGNPAHANDRHRSLPPGAAASLLAPLHDLAATRPSLRLIGLQTGPRHADLAALGITDLSPALADFAETAAVIATLDLVVTVDTAIAHLAGAMGKPVWLMLPHAPDWRWQLVRTDSPWYASMRLFRQPAPGDWQSVVRAIAAALSNFATPTPWNG